MEWKNKKLTCLAIFSSELSVKINKSYLKTTYDLEKLNWITSSRVIYSFLH